MDEDAGFVAPVYQMMHTDTGPVLKQVRRLPTDYAARAAPYLKRTKSVNKKDEIVRRTTVGHRKPDL